MSFWDLIVSPEMAPFSAAIGLILLFLVLEIVSLLAGASLFGADGGADVDTPDIDAPNIDGPDLNAPDFDTPDLDAGDIVSDHGAVSDAGGILAWLGLGEAPFMVWLTGLLAAFGLTGYVGQLILREVTGELFTAWPIALVAALVGLTAAKRLSRLIARLLPRVQTEAVSERRLGGRVGVVTVGTARMGRPAEAKVADRFGNIHYIRVEPARPGDELAQGAEIAILQCKNRIYRAIRLDQS